MKIIIGGSCASSEICEYVRADGWSTNAFEGIKICQKWMKDKLSD